MLIYEIPGKPIPWARAGRSGRTYYDTQLKEKKRLQWEIKMLVKAAFKPSEPLKVTMVYHMPIPSSWSKIRQKKAIGTPHTSKPDIDNLAKFIGDGLNQVVWKDDAQIAEMHLRKVYAEDPKTQIKVESLAERNLIDML